LASATPVILRHDSEATFIGNGTISPDERRPDDVQTLAHHDI
jgi:hypothetical protein